MLVKTRQFDTAFQEDIKVLYVVNSPIDFKGSYRLKNFGDVLTDIDLSHHVLAENSLIGALKDWAKRVKSSKNFFFLAMNCGMYRQFRPPWSVDKGGDCVYNPEKAREWLKSIEKLVSEEVYQKLREKLLSPTISIRDLIETKQITRPYSEIVWSLEDLMAGEKRALGETYTIPQLMREGYFPIAKLIYRFENTEEYCAVDFTLSDRRFKSELSPLHDYYLEDYYKIFKSYKWYIEYQYKREFANSMRGIQRYTGLLGRVKLLEMIDKYKIPLATEKLREGVRQQARILGIPIEDLPRKISEESKRYIEYFRHRVQEKYISTIDKYQIRAKEAKARIIQAEIKDSGECPFFSLPIDLFDKVYDLARRSLLHPERVIECIKNVASTHGKTAIQVAKELALTQELRLVRGLYDIEVYRGNELLFREPFQESTLNKLKTYVLTGVKV